MSDQKNVGSIGEITIKGLLHIHRADGSVEDVPFSTERPIAVPLSLPEEKEQEHGDC